MPIPTMLHDLFIHMLLHQKGRTGRSHTTFRKALLFRKLESMSFHFVCIRKVLRPAILIQVILVFLRLEVNVEMGAKFDAATGRVKTLAMSELRISWAEIQTRAFPNWKQ